MSEALAEVLDGWTGTITVGGYAVTPRQSESVASLMARVVAEVYARSRAATGAALTLRVTVSSSGVLSIASGGDAFAVVATSNTATRTGFTGTYTGAASYTAAGAYTGAWVPSAGLQLDMAQVTVERGEVTLSGSAASVAQPIAMRSTLTAWTTYADTWPSEERTGLYDVWSDGPYLLGRVFVEGWTRTHPTTLRTGTMRLDAQVEACSIEPIPEIPQTWPVASAWLWSWVNTEVPGYREAEFDGGGAVVPSGHWRWDQFIDELNTLADTIPVDRASVALEPSGAVRFEIVVGAWSILWIDRMGWLLGFGLEAGTSDIDFVSNDVALSRFVPPGGIPLLGAAWSEITLEHDLASVKDRHRRRFGYVAGAARIYRVTCTMTRWALQALLTGWCLRGKVSVVCGNNTTPIGPTEPGGEITGFVLGLDRVSWLSSAHQRDARVEILIAAEVS